MASKAVVTYNQVMVAKGRMAELMELPPADRMQLAEELRESLAATPEQVPVTDAQKRELDARLDAYRANPTAGSSWDEVKERILRPKP